MYIKSILYILILLIIGNSFQLQGQTLYYDVVKGSKKLGEMVAVKKNRNDTAIYEITSDVEIRLLFSFRIKYYLEESYKDGQLISGNAYNTLNEKMQKQSVVQYNGENYVINLNGEVHDVPQPEALYSVSHLYFDKPDEISKVFSQQFAELLPIVETEEDLFMLESPEGKNYYQYNKKGYCEEVKVSRAYATFYFKLREVQGAEANRLNSKTISDSN